MVIQSHNQDQASAVLDMFKAAAENYQGVINNDKVTDKDAVISISGRSAVLPSKTDKTGFFGALFRSKAERLANADARESFMIALKVMLNVSSDKQLEEKLGADVLKLSDFKGGLFSSRSSHPLSAFRIKTILNKVQDLLSDTVKSAPMQSQEVKQEPTMADKWAPLMGDLEFEQPEVNEQPKPEDVQESDEDVQKQFDDFYAEATPANTQAESERLVSGLWKSDRRRVEDIVGTKSQKSKIEDEKMARKMDKAQNQPNQHVEASNNKTDVGGIGTTLLTPLSWVASALTDRDAKRAQAIAGSNVNEEGLDIQSQIDEDLEAETEIAQGAPAKTEVNEQPKTESKGTDKTIHQEHDVKGGSLQSEIRHNKLSPDYTLGLGNRGVHEFITDISDWKETSYNAFVDDIRDDLDARPFQPEDVLTKSFEKLGQFFERPQNAVGFKYETPSSIAKCNDRLGKELASNLKIHNNPATALQVTAKKLHTMDGNYAQYLSEILERISKEI